MKRGVEEVVQTARIECCDCHKTYKHLESCKDGKTRCKRCKKKMPTNKWYNPNWRETRFIGKFSVNTQEYNLLIAKYQKMGLSYAAAKRKVGFDLTAMKKNRQRKFAIEKAEERKELSVKQMNDDFLRGLGQK